MAEVKVPDDGGETITMVNVGDYIVPNFPVPAHDIKATVDALPDFECRNDDVLIAAFPKTGTTWLYEIVMMIRKQSMERIQGNKIELMLEKASAKEINGKESPRVLNTHLPPRFLPKDLKKKKIKTILCCRNPKDTAVSYYNHMRCYTVFYYAGQWKNWLGPHVRGELEYGKYGEYLNEWQAAIEDGTGYPIHVVYYEDLKKNGEEEIDRLADFLGVTVDAKLKKDILHMCGFDKMAKDKTPDEEDRKAALMNPDFNTFRKGEVGDWKNWFTKAQDELLETSWKKTIRKDTMFEFKYV